MKAFRTATLLASLFFSASAQAQSQAQRDAEYLQEFIVPFAKLQLERRGVFPPIGAALKANDKFILMPVDKTAVSMLPTELIELMQEALVQGAADGEYKTTALAYDATVPLPSSGKPSDAIAIALDHRDGYSVITFLPYELRGKEVLLGTPFTRQGAGSVFKQK